MVLKALGATQVEAAKIMRELLRQAAAVRGAKGRPELAIVVHVWAGRGSLRVQSAHVKCAVFRVDILGFLVVVCVC